MRDLNPNCLAGRCDLRSEASPPDPLSTAWRGGTQTPADLRPLDARPPSPRSGEGPGVRLRSARRPKGKTPWILSALFAFALVSAACHKASPEAVDTVEAVPVTTATAQAGPIRAVVAATGQVKPAAGAELLVVPPQDARIAELTKGVGDRVRRGELLVRFEIPSLTADAATKRSDLARAEAQLVTARENVTRLSGLFQRGIAARKEVEDAQRDLKQAEATVAEGQSTTAAAGQLAGRAVVRAPFDGVVVGRSHQTGDLVSPGRSRAAPARDRSLAPAGRGGGAGGRPGEGRRAAARRGCAAPPSPTRRPTSSPGRRRSIPPPARPWCGCAFDTPTRRPAGLAAEVEIYGPEHQAAVLVPADALVQEGHGELPVHGRRAEEGPPPRGPGGRGGRRQGRDPLRRRGRRDGGDPRPDGAAGRRPVESRPRRPKRSRRNERRPHRRAPGARGRPRHPAAGGGRRAGAADAAERHLSAAPVPPPAGDRPQRLAPGALDDDLGDPAAGAGGHGGPRHPPGALARPSAAPPRSRRSSIPTPTWPAALQNLQNRVAEVHTDLPAETDAHRRAPDGLLLPHAQPEPDRRPAHARPQRLRLLRRAAGAGAGPGRRPGRGVGDRHPGDRGGGRSRPPARRRPDRGRRGRPR